MATTKIPFRTAYSGQILRKTEPGKGIIEEYEYDYNKKNEKELVKTGEKNLYQIIQAHHEETKIENILARVAVGDMSDFRPNGIFADTTGLPKNLIDSQKQILKVQQFWDRQPIDIKRKYNFNVDAFMADIGSQAWLINTGLLNPAATEPTPVAEAPNTKVETPEANT